MRKMILVLTLALGACGQINTQLTVGNVYDADALLGVLGSAVNSYRNLCIAKNSFVYPQCRTVHPIIAKDLTVARGQVSQAVSFIRANPSGSTTQIGLLQQAQASIDQLKSDLAKYNIPVIGGN